jgi:hypothetical protein
MKKQATTNEAESSMSAERLAAILQKGDQKACVKFFRDMPEKDRRQFAAQALVMYKKENRIVEIGKGSFGFSDAFDAAQVAVYAACSLAEIRKIHAFLSDDELDDVLLNRRPIWLSDWAAWFCEELPMRWAYLRRLIRDGLCRQPVSDSYTLGMIVGLSPYYETNRTIYEALVADNELLKEDIWRIFEIEGDKDLTLAARDKYSRQGNTWTAALLQLCQEGRLSRARLLDASLDALQRDFKQFHAGWFSRFHEALQPSIQERTERAERYLTLLGSKIPPTVSFALHALSEIDPCKKLCTAAAIESVRPALWSRQKGTVQQCLYLLGSIIELAPRLREQIVITALEGLQHESAQVQSAVLAFVEKFATTLSPSVIKLLHQRIGNLAASLRARAAKLIPEVMPAQKTATTEFPINAKELVGRARRIDKKWIKAAGIENAVAVLQSEEEMLRAICFDPMKIPHLGPNLKLEPIADVNELIDVFGRILEEPGDPMQVERVLDGVSRLCDQRPTDFAIRTGPLAKRAKQRMVCGPFVGVDLLQDLCGLALAWTTGEMILPERVKAPHGGTYSVWYEWTPKHNKFWTSVRPTLTKFCSLRLLSLARRATDRCPGPLLSFPTHSGGWIDPRELVCRSRLLGAEPADTFDQVLALLRLAPEHRSEAWKAAQGIPGEWGQVLCYALGAPAEDGIGSTAALWIAAARARAPRADDQGVEARHPGLGPDTGVAAKYAFAVKRHSGLRLPILEIDPGTKPTRQLVIELVTPLLHGTRWTADRSNFYEPEVGDSADRRWIMTIWPMNRQPYFAASCDALARNLDWVEADWANKTYLESLLDPDTALEEMGYLLLALGLAAKEPGEYGLATDALIAAIDDGRVDAEGLGGILARLLPTGLVKAARYAKTLGQSARVSSLHAWTIARALERGLRHDPAQAPRDLSALLELLRELLAELGQPLTDLEARQYLGHLKAGGKTARLVRELLALSSESSSGPPKAAAVRALENRLQRAERWTGGTKTKKAS